MNPVTVAAPFLFNGKLYRTARGLRDAALRSNPVATGCGFERGRFYVSKGETKLFAFTELRPEITIIHF